MCNSNFVFKTCQFFWYSTSKNVVTLKTGSEVTQGQGYWVITESRELSTNYTIADLKISCWTLLVGWQEGHPICKKKFSPAFPIGSSLKDVWGHGLTCSNIEIIGELNKRKLAQGPHTVWVIGVHRRTSVGGGVVVSTSHWRHCHWLSGVVTAAARHRARCRCCERRCRRGRTRPKPHHCQPYSFSHALFKH